MPERTPCYRDDDCAMFACIRCGGTGWVKPEIASRECGEPADDGSGRVCRRVCAPGRDYHGGGHWFADPDLNGEAVRLSTARFIVMGEQPGRALLNRIGGPGSPGPQPPRRKSHGRYGRGDDHVPCALCDGYGDVVNPGNADPDRKVTDWLPPVGCPRCGQTGKDPNP